MDALGNPTHLHLSAGNIHDITEAPKLVEAAKGKKFLADKAYDAKELIKTIEEKQMTAVIPARKNRIEKREIDAHEYKERRLVENFFCKLKQYRRIASRYEKNAQNYFGFVLFAAIRILLA